MMQTIIVIALTILAVVVIFSVQNASPVALSFLFWKFEASLAVVVFLTFITGILMTMLIYYLRSFNKLMKNKKP